MRQLMRFHRLLLVTLAALPPIALACVPSATFSDASPDGALTLDAASDISTAVDATGGDASPDARDASPPEASADADADAATPTALEGEIALGGMEHVYFGCFRRNGDLRCAGRNESGQLGRGTTGDGGVMLPLGSVANPE